MYIMLHFAAFRAILCKSTSLSALKTITVIVVGYTKPFGNSGLKLLSITLEVRVSNHLVFLLFFMNPPGSFAVA